MTWGTAGLIAGAIICAALILERAILTGAAGIVGAIEKASAENRRIGTKIDNLWSPIKGINTLLWKKSGISPDYGSDYDDRP